MINANLRYIFLNSNPLSELKHTHREKSPSNKTRALAQSTIIGIWVVGTQLFIRGS